MKRASQQGVTDPDEIAASMHESKQMGKNEANNAAKKEEHPHPKGGKHDGPEVLDPDDHKVHFHFCSHASLHVCPDIAYASLTYLLQYLRSVVSPLSHSVLY